VSPPNGVVQNDTCSGSPRARYAAAKSLAQLCSAAGVLKIVRFHHGGPTAGKHCLKVVKHSNRRVGIGNNLLVGIEGKIQPVRDSETVTHEKLNRT
jgi:hypothetical protein